MGTFTAQILVGHDHRNHGGIIQCFKTICLNDFLSVSQSQPIRISLF